MREVSSADSLVLDRSAATNVANATVTWSLLLAGRPTAVAAISATEAFVAFEVKDAFLGGSHVYRATWSGSNWTLEHVVGSGEQRWNGDLVQRRSMNLGGEILGLVYDAAESVLYVSDRRNNRLVAVNLGTTDATVAGLKIGPDEARTVAGGGKGLSGFNGDAIPPDLALLSGPSGVALGPNGDVVIVDQGNGRLRRFQKR